MRHSPLNASEMADIIERFLTNSSSYPQEWNDFIESKPIESALEPYRARCYDLDPLVNSPAPPDPNGIHELETMISELRSQEP